LSRARPGGQTSLLDAIDMALSQMKDARYARKALVILSDGGDNHSRRNEREIKREMLESDVQVYAMGIYGPLGVRGLPREERNGPRLLTALAEQTGGEHFAVRSVNELPRVCARIGEELRSQYLLGYSPSNPARDGKYRRVKVVLVRPPGAAPARVYTRSGDHAPSN
jgi:Ca-activated chloride channel family protein